MELMYAIIDRDKKVVKAFVGDLNTVKSDLILNQEEAIQITLDNSPAKSGYYYDGKKFVKELVNV